MHIASSEKNDGIIAVSRRVDELHVLPKSV